MLTFAGVIDDDDAEDNDEVLMPKADPKVGTVFALIDEILLVEACIDEVDVKDTALDTLLPIDDCTLGLLIMKLGGVCASRAGDEGISIDGNGVPRVLVLLVSIRSTCDETTLLSISANGCRSDCWLPWLDIVNFFVMAVWVDSLRKKASNAGGSSS